MNYDAYNLRNDKNVFMRIKCEHKYKTTFWKTLTVFCSDISQEICLKISTNTIIYKH